MNTDPEQDEGFQNTTRSVIEMRRLGALSNKDLVQECMRFPDYNDADQHIEEMMSRLWPECFGEISFGARVKFVWSGLKELVRIARGL